MTDDAAMLAHAVTWRHWNGGPDEDIFVEFGITPLQFFHRLRRILAGDGGHDLEPVVVSELLEVCNRRIRLPLAQAG